MLLPLQNPVNKKIVIHAAALLATIMIGLIDIVTSYTYRFSLFYIAAIFFSGMFLSRYYCWFIAILSVAFNFLVYFLSFNQIHPFIVWNTIMMASLYLFTIYIIEKFKTLSVIKVNNAVLKEKIYIQESSLKEKELLIREIHHRMKNVLTSIRSIINLSNNTDSSRLLQSLSSRITTYSVLYTKLAYSADNTGTVDLDEYVREIVNLIFETGDYPARKIACDIEGDAIYVASQEANIIGLIVNELTTNSIRHAFDGIDEARINIIIKKQEQGMLLLKYHDNGPGFDADNKMLEENHLGMQLIDTMTRQLKGTYQYNYNNGAEFIFQLHIPAES